MFIFYVLLHFTCCHLPDTFIGVVTLLESIIFNGKINYNFTVGYLTGSEQNIMKNNCDTQKASSYVHGFQPIYLYNAMKIQVV